MADSARSPCFGFFGKRENNITPKLKSVSCTDATSGLHHFEIQNYSVTKGRGVGTKIVSSSFYVGGHYWRIMCYLDGANKEDKDNILVYLQYCPKFDKEPRAKFSFSLLDHTTGEASSCLTIFTRNSIQFTLSKKVKGFPKFIRRDVMEASSCLKDDTLTIICNVTVVREPRTHKTKVSEIVKPSTLSKPQETTMSVEKVADIIFEVDGKCFSAHSTVVASSSPIFRAQLSDMMKDGKEQKIKLRDIEAPVFEALLKYIYTDELPKIEILTDKGMAEHLLVAADRFGMHNLTKSCQRKLSEGLDVSNVCTALVLAEKNHLTELRRACLEYLSSPIALVSAMATEGFVQLVQCYPSISKEISGKVNITKHKKLYDYIKI